MQDMEVTITLRTTMEALEGTPLAKLIGFRDQREGQPRRTTYSGRAPQGSRLHEREYRLPLLEVLAESGGSAPLKEATDAVGQKLHDRLRPIDFKPNPSGRGMRWRNRVQWVRSRLVREGLLRSDSPRGVWELTDKGWDQVKTSKTNSTRSAKGKRASSATS